MKKISLSLLFSLVMISGFSQPYFDSLHQDSIFSPAKMQKFQLLLADAEKKQREVTLAVERYRDRVRLYSLIAIAGVFLVLLLIMYRNNRQKQKTFTLIKQQKEETDIQKGKVELAFAWRRN